MGGGVVGGKVAGAYSQGRAAARMAGQLLAGAALATLPVITSETRFVFHYPALQRWSIDRRALPPNSAIIDEPVTLWTQHRALLLGVLAAFVVLVAIIIVLMVVDAGRRARRVDLANVVDAARAGRSPRE